MQPTFQVFYFVIWIFCAFHKFYFTSRQIRKHNWWLVVLIWRVRTTTDQFLYTRKRFTIKIVFASKKKIVLKRNAIINLNVQIVVPTHSFNGNLFNLEVFNPNCLCFFGINSGFNPSQARWTHIRRQNSSNAYFSCVA